MPPSPLTHVCVCRCHVSLRRRIYKSRQGADINIISGVIFSVYQICTRAWQTGVSASVSWRHLRSTTNGDFVVYLASEEQEWYAQRGFAVSGRTLHLELTAADRAWSVTDTDSILCTPEDHAFLLLNTTRAPLWPFVCSVVRCWMFFLLSFCVRLLTSQSLTRWRHQGTHRIIALLLIYLPRKDERLSWPSWLTCSGRFTHIVVTRRLQAVHRTGSVRRPTVLCNQPK